MKKQNIVPTVTYKRSESNREYAKMLTDRYKDNEGIVPCHASFYDLYTLTELNRLFAKILKLKRTPYVYIDNIDDLVPWGTHFDNVILRFILRKLREFAKNNNITIHLTFATAALSHTWMRIVAETDDRSVRAVQTHR